MRRSTIFSTFAAKSDSWGELSSGTTIRRSSVRKCTQQSYTATASDANPRSVTFGL
jgi:hypothetical protein